MIGLCNFSANSILDMISFLIASPEVFYEKMCKPLKQDLIDTHQMLDLWQY